jgi:hypothetical protein
MESVSNAKRDGKCLRYRPGWQFRTFAAIDLDQAFERVVADYASDIEGARALRGRAIVQCKDSRRLALQLPPGPKPFDAVLTSPPYLNSFDYTDIYRPHCLLLGAASSAADLRKLRFLTLRSHVQVEWPCGPACKLESVQNVVRSLRQRPLWNRRLPDMVNAYFVDLDAVVAGCRRAVRNGGRLGFVVAASAYAGIVVPVQSIVAELFAANGIRWDETMVLRTSPGNAHHQQRAGEHLEESLVVGTVS